MTKRTPVQRFWAQVDRTGECWLWTGGTVPRGYGVFRLSRPVRRKIYAHRFSYELASGGPIPCGMFVCHRCDTPACVRPDHLFLGTHADNMRDMCAKGRVVAGEAQHMAKLSVAAVVEIRALAASGVDRTELAVRFGVHPRTISDVIRRATWKHVP